MPPSPFNSAASAVAFPPVSPLGIGQAAIYVTKLVFTATGTVEDYQARQDAFASRLATHLGVSTEQISISIRAASVVIEAKITSLSDSAATSIAEDLSSTLNSASAAADFFGVAVLEDPTVSTLSGVMSTPSPPSIDGVVDAITSDDERVALGPIIGGALDGVALVMALACILGCWLCKRKARKKKHDLPGNHPVVVEFQTHPMQVEKI